MKKTNQVTLTFLKISILASLFFVTAAPSIITGNTGPTSASTMTANKYADHTKVGKGDLIEGVVNDMKVKVVNERRMLAINPSILKDKIKQDMILKEEVEDPCENILKGLYMEGGGHACVTQDKTQEKIRRLNGLKKPKLKQRYER